jgi:hypothetical protein
MEILAHHEVKGKLLCDEDGGETGCWKSLRGREHSAAERLTYA